MQSFFFFLWTPSMNLFNFTLWMFYSVLCDWSMLQVHKHTQKSLEENTFISKGRKMLFWTIYPKLRFLMLDMNAAWLFQIFRITVSKHKLKLPCHVISANTVSNLGFEIQMTLICWTNMVLKVRKTDITN